MELSLSEFGHLSPYHQQHLLDVGQKALEDAMAIVPMDFFEQAPRILPLKTGHGAGDLAETELGEINVAQTDEGSRILVPAIRSIRLRNVTDEQCEDENELLLLRQAIRHEIFHVVFHHAASPFAQSITEGFVARFEEEHRKHADVDGAYYYGDICGHASTTGLLVEDNAVCRFSPKTQHILYESVQKDLSRFEKDKILDVLAELSAQATTMGVYPCIKQIRTTFLTILGSLAEGLFMLRPAANGEHVQLSFMLDAINLNSFTIRDGKDNSRYGGMKQVVINEGDRICLAYHFMEKMSNGEELNCAGGITQFWPPIRIKYIDLLRLTGISESAIEKTRDIAHRIEFEVYPKQEDYFAGADKRLSASVFLQ